MAYSLVIAEDEQMMRNSLVRMIGWQELGFEVSACFSDGAEVLDYLKSNIPDVLLADIKMIRVSGLEVAKFIRDNKLPVRVVLLSGHRDFEYAQLAVEYNVEHYLLKPVSIPKMKQLFSELRAQFDRRTVLDDAMQYRADRYTRLVNYEKQQFILDAVMGTIGGPAEFKKRLELIGVNDDALQQKCVLFDIALEQDDAFNRFIEEFGSEELRGQLVQLLESFDERMEFYQIESWKNRLTGLFWEKKGTDCINNYRSGEKPIPALLEELVRMMTGLTCRVESLFHFDSLPALTEYQYRVNQTKPPLSFESDPSYYHRLREQKKLLLTYIKQGDLSAARQLLESFIGQSLLLGLTFAQNQMVHFFSIATEKISDGDIVEFSRLLYSMSVIEVSALTTERQLLRWGERKLGQLIEFLRDNGRLSNGSDCIAKIQQYIRSNYAKDVTLSDAAEQVYLNPIYISRIFKERTGKTFTEYLSEVRIRTAVDYLDNSNRYVYEISELVGYHNIKYFYKIFRKMIGCSPSEYRERKPDAAGGYSGAAGELSGAAGGYSGTAGDAFGAAGEREGP